MFVARLMLMNYHLGLTMIDYHHGANVKDYGVYDKLQDYPERFVKRAYDDALVLFWDELERIACDLGYDGVYQEGRSGGWAIPHKSGRYIDSDDPQLEIFKDEAEELMNYYREWYCDRVIELVNEADRALARTTAHGNFD